MSKAKNHVPEGLSAVTPQLVAPDARILVDFLNKAFGAELLHAMPGPDGRGIMHGMLRLADSLLFVADAGFAPPTQANLFIYVPEVDATFAKALAAGAKQLQPVADMFWGDRWGMFADPSGNVWQVATNRETLTPEEMQQRMRAAMAPSS